MATDREGDGGVAVNGYPTVLQVPVLVMVWCLEHQRATCPQRVSTHTHTHTHIHTLACMHARTHARTHEHARTHTHARTHARAHTHTHTHTSGTEEQ